MKTVDVDRLRKGELIEINGKIYGLCRGCKKVVRINKPIFGSMHFCE